MWHELEARTRQVSELDRGEDVLVLKKRNAHVRERAAIYGAYVAKTAPCRSERETFKSAFLPNLDSVPTAKLSLDSVATVDIWLNAQSRGSKLPWHATELDQSIPPWNSSLKFCFSLVDESLSDQPMFLFSGLMFLLNFDF